MTEQPARHLRAFVLVADAWTTAARNFARLVAVSAIPATISFALSIAVAAGTGSGLPALGITAVGLAVAIAAGALVLEQGKPWAFALGEAGRRVVTVGTIGIVGALGYLALAVAGFASLGRVLPASTASWITFGATVVVFSLLLPAIPYAVAHRSSPWEAIAESARMVGRHIGSASAALFLTTLGQALVATILFIVVPWGPLEMLSVLAVEILVWPVSAALASAAHVTFGAEADSRSRSPRSA